MSNIKSINVNGQQYEIDSATSSSELPVIDYNNGDFGIADEDGNILVNFKDGHIKTKNFDSNNTNNKINIKVLCYGNSWSRDAFSYLPALIENILGIDNVNVQFGIMYIGGCTLETHYNRCINGGNYSFDLWKTSIGKWTTTSQNFKYPLLNYDWDIVLFQQQSSAARDYSTYQPYLNNLINGIFNTISYPIKLGWHMTPPYPNGYSVIGSDTSETMYAKIVNSVHRVLNETAIEFVIPDGTAIINAMTTSLDTLGSFGHLFYEGLHLQEGIPCILESYVAAITLFNIYGVNNHSIYCSTIRPTETWINSINGLERHGSSVGVTEDNIKLAQKIAIMSIKKPYEITNCKNIFE